MPVPLSDVQSSPRSVPVSAGCAAHKVHLPAPTYLELHHVIPQSWQKFWSGNTELWDPHTVPLCRTGHGNVHFWLVWLMKNYDGSIPKIPLMEKYVRKEAAIARQAMERWIEHGGSIEALRARKLWGQI